MEFLDNYESNTSAWTDKYKPTKIADIIGNKKGVNDIIKWLQNFKDNKIKNLQAKKEKNNKKGKKTKKKLKVIKEPAENEELENNDVIDNENTGETLEDNLDENLEKGISDNIEEEINPEVLEIDNNIKSDKKDSYSCLLITGNHGVGKTCSIYAILKELKYSIQIINFNRIKSNKNINDILDRISNSHNILNLIFGNKNKNSALIIDEIEAITSQTEKNCILELIKNNEENWNQPIIFISNNQHNKLLNDIKKNSQEIKFWQPYPEDMGMLFKKICTKEKIKVELPNAGYIVSKIIDFAQKDIRRLVFILQDLKYTYGEKVITKQNIDDFCETSKKKDIDFDLRQGSKKLLDSYTNLEETFRYFDSEKTIVPLIMYHNYIGAINDHILPKNNKFELSSKISELLSKSDVIENLIHSTQNWDMQEIQGFMACSEPSFLLDKNLSQHRSINWKYPIDLNRTSTKQINKKNNLNKINTVFHNMNINDYVNINQIIRQYINDGKMKECVDLFKGYGIKLEILESILKVDKIKSSKTNLTSKQKKELSEFL